MAKDIAPNSRPSSVQRRRTRLGFLMRDAARLMRRRFIYLARQVELPINQSEASFLVQISSEPGTSQADLASYLDLEPIAVARLIDRLERRGLVERRNHEMDRRIWRIWATAAAEPVLKDIDAIRHDVHKDALLGISNAERDKMIDTLRSRPINFLSRRGAV